jgi:hypothetical protein
MSALRGGFRSAVYSASGQSGSSRGKMISNVVWGAVLLAAVLFLLYRFGLFR